MQIKWVYDGLYKVGMGLDEALCLRLGRVTPMTQSTFLSKKCEGCLRFTRYLSVCLSTFLSISDTGTTQVYFPGSLEVSFS